MLRSKLNELAVTGTTSPVSVASGVAWVYGTWYQNDSALNVTVATPVTNPRIDRIILRYSSAAQTVRITRLAGTEAASPTAPALTQNSTTYEVSLAQARITTGGVITVTDERAWVKNPGVFGAIDGTTIDYDSTNKVIRVKDGSITGTKLSLPITIAGQITDTTAGQGSNAGIVLSSAQPGLTWYETDASADEKMWHATVNGKVLRFGVATDANTGNVYFLSVNRGTGTAITSVDIAANTNITGTLAASGAASSAGLASSAQVSSTASGNATNAAFYASSANPTIAVNETDGASDGKLWDLTTNGGVMSLRAINDAQSSNTTPLAITRSGTTISSIALAATTVAITGNATVSGTITGNLTGNVTGNASTATTASAISDGAVSTTAKLANDVVDDTKVGNRVAQWMNRQGGSATDWATTGTSTQTPTMVRTQGGAISISFSGSQTFGTAISTTSVTLPTTYSGTPLVKLTIGPTSASNIAGQVVATVSAVTTSSFSIALFPLVTQSYGASSVTVFWETTGPE